MSSVSLHRSLFLLSDVRCESHNYFGNRNFILLPRKRKYRYTMQPFKDSEVTAGAHKDSLQQRRIKCHL
jgi:hypothetical protein